MGRNADYRDCLWCADGEYAGGDRRGAGVSEGGGDTWNFDAGDRFFLKFQG